jgi:hypothetical protein
MARTIGRGGRYGKTESSGKYEDCLHRLTPELFVMRWQRNR